ncbi:MAG TPA: hypothetical protein VGT06_13905 [Candidatus Methylomirabilis sp.]|nr:hypothetical protein [Candidatus Methylomirabilis sp.]
MLPATTPGQEQEQLAGPPADRLVPDLEALVAFLEHHVGNALQVITTASQLAQADPTYRPQWLAIEQSCDRIAATVQALANTLHSRRSSSPPPTD